MSKRIAIGIKLDPALVERIDAFRAALPFHPTRTAIIETAVESLLDGQERAADLKQRKPREKSGT